MEEGGRKEYFYVDQCNDLRLRPALRYGVKLHRTVKILQHSFKCNVHVRDTVITEYLSQQISTSVQHPLEEIAKSQNCACTGQKLSISFTLWHRVFLWEATTVQMFVCLFQYKTLCLLFSNQEFVKSSFDGNMDML